MEVKNYCHSYQRCNLDGWTQYSGLLAVESCITAIRKWMNATFSKLPKDGTSPTVSTTVLFYEGHPSLGFLLAQDPRKFLKSVLSHSGRPVERMQGFPLLILSSLSVLQVKRGGERGESVYCLLKKTLSGLCFGCADPLRREKCFQCCY